MNLNEDFLENTLNELESSFDEVSKLKFTLLDSTLDQIRSVFELSEEGVPVFESLTKEDKEELQSTLDVEMLPLFEEFEYKKGIDQIQEWKKLLQENLE